MGEENKVYKALQETPEGELISLRAQAGECHELSYKEGEITYTPEGSMGIFTDDTLGRAIANGTSNRYYYRNHGGTLVIHEVIPLGKMLEKHTGVVFSNFDRYPAVLVGKEVWREKPKEEWIDVTKECEPKIHCAEDFHWVSLWHGGFERIILGKKARLWMESDKDYRVEFAPAGISYDGFKIFKRTGG